MYYIGIDLGGTNVKCGVFDGTGKLYAADSVPTGDPSDYLEVIRRMGTLAHDLIAKAGLTQSDIAAAGIGSPGTVDGEAGVIVYANNLYWKNVNIRKHLSKYLSCPIFVSNDANVAAIGEYYFGAARGKKSLVLLTLGTGVGGGVILNGQLFEGNKSAGTELGHTKIGSKGHPCTCGRKDCLETYASATALIRETKKKMQKCPDSAMWQYSQSLENVDGRTAFECAKAGDRAATAVVRSYINALADGVANFVNIFMPDIVVIGGGVCAQGDYLLKPLTKKVRAMQYGKKLSPFVEIKIAEMGNHAGILGAMSLAMMQTKERGLE